MTYDNNSYYCTIWFFSKKNVKNNKYILINWGRKITLESKEKMYRGIIYIWRDYILALLAIYTESVNIVEFLKEFTPLIDV